MYVYATNISNHLKKTKIKLCIPNVHWNLYEMTNLLLRLFEYLAM